MPEEEVCRLVDDMLDGGRLMARSLISDPDYEGVDEWAELTLELGKTKVIKE